MINASVGGQGNGRWVKFLREEAGQFAPQLVVLQACGNDFSDNQLEALFCLSRSGELVELPVPPPGKESLVQSVIEAVPGLANSHMVGLLREVAANLHEKAAQQPQAMTTRVDSTRSTESDALTYALIERSLEICQDRGWPVVLLTEKFGGERLSELKRLCERRGVPLLPVPLRSERPDLYYQVDGHWNAAGQAYVAQKLLEQLASADLFPRPVHHRSNPAEPGKTARAPSQGTSLQAICDPVPSPRRLVSTRAARTSNKSPATANSRQVRGLD